MLSFLGVGLFQSGRNAPAWACVARVRVCRAHQPYGSRVSYSFFASPFGANLHLEVTFAGVLFKGEVLRGMKIADL